MTPAHGLNKTPKLFVNLTPQNRNQMNEIELGKPADVGGVGSEEEAPILTRQGSSAEEVESPSGVPTRELPERPSKSRRVSDAAPAAVVQAISSSESPPDAPPM